MDCSDGDDDNGDDYGDYYGDDNVDCLDVDISRDAREIA